LSGRLRHGGGEGLAQHGETRAVVRALRPDRVPSMATPCLVLDADRMERNIARLRSRLDGLGSSSRVEAEWSRFGGWQ
jgi:hypothetical protein